MCGIYGIVNLKDQAEPSRALLARMGDVIAHRGPNDKGHYFDHKVALGMRRLSIIDLAGGHQPISNEDGTVWVICNGEIYNYQELRKELGKKGHRFQTNSDTEVLVHLYEEEGTEFLKRLRGMFAIALWDAPRSRLLIARDRLGKKPLYARQEFHRILFASEVKSILEDREVPRRLDRRALQEYLTLGYVPAPETLFEGIQKVLPGHYWLIEGGQVQDRPYWEVRFNQIEKRSESEWIELVREKLLESVRIRMISDVPLGAFLSGGVDSSAVVAAMAQCTDQPIKTYSIGFEGQDRFYNELPFAKTIAERFRTDHHEIIVRPRVAELMPKLIWHLDEPMADSAFITTYLVSQLASESVTVILSGVGGDELFGGYRRYLGDAILEHYGKLPGFVRNSWLPALLSRLPQDRGSGWKNNLRYASAFVKSAQLEPAARYASYVTVFSPEVRTRLLCDSWKEPHGGSGFVSEILHSYFRKAGGSDLLHQNIYVDLKTSLPDDLLLLTDKMSMAASIECRAPFMDQELVELTSHIPSQLKVRGLNMKYLLKKALRPWLPAEILHRKKRGFGAPVGSWLRTDLNRLVEETLSVSEVKKRGLFEPRVVKEIIDDHREQKNDHTDHLLSLISLELWCRIFLDGNQSGDLAAARTEEWQEQA
jgi:asparagine synthase (glutamine-hydrolysing)